MVSCYNSFIQRVVKRLNNLVLHIRLFNRYSGKLNYGINSTFSIFYYGLIEEFHKLSTLCLIILTYDLYTCDGRHLVILNKIKSKTIVKDHPSMGSIPRISFRIHGYNIRTAERQ